MRALLQRVTQASVSVDGKTVGQTGPGLLILFCAMAGDTPDLPEKLARKIARLRIFADEAGKMNRSLLDTGGSALVVSQFTLAAETGSGNRPSYSKAAPPAEGEVLYLDFVTQLRGLGIVTGTGAFGAYMSVSLVNDGPATIWIEL